MNRQVKQNYQTLRVRLIQKGTNIRKWAIGRGYPLMTVYSAAKGQRAGIKAVKIQKELNEYAFGK